MNRNRWSSPSPSSSSFPRHDLASVGIIIIIIESLARLISFAEHNKSIPRRIRRPYIMRDARVRWPDAMALAWKWKTITHSMRPQMLRNWNAIQLNDRRFISFHFIRSNWMVFFFCFSSEWIGRWVSKSFNTLVWLKVCQKERKINIAAINDWFPHVWNLECDLLKIF